MFTPSPDSVALTAQYSAGIFCFIDYQHMAPIRHSRGSKRESTRFLNVSFQSISSRKMSESRGKNAQEVLYYLGCPVPFCTPVFSVHVNKLSMAMKHLSERRDALVS